ncbi:MAG TPA: hypothetical protein VF765_04955 [Polyangiaceae bacterium]
MFDGTSQQSCPAVQHSLPQQNVLVPQPSMVSPCPKESAEGVVHETMTSEGIDRPTHASHHASDEDARRRRAQ